MSKRRAVLLATAVSLLVPAQGTLSTRTAAAGSDVVWGTCPPTEMLPTPPAELQCTELAVPMDYKEPDGRTIKITVSRLKAKDPSKRRGALMLNQGGPGGWGINFPLDIAADAPPEVADAYDLVSFDPRGVQLSSPLNCKITDDQMMETNYPAPGGDISRNITVARDVAKQCADHNPTLLRHVTTENTARDMDRIRVALGEEKISYLGYSYGTYLGAVYASLFPQHTDRFVLDSVVNPNVLWRGLWLQWEKATEVRFAEFAAWTAARHSTYSLGRTAAEVRRTYLSLVYRLDRKPAATPEGMMSGNRLRERTRGPGLYRANSPAFPQLAALLQAIDQGSGTPSLAAAAKSQEESLLIQSFMATLLAVSCGEAHWPKNPAFYQADVLRSRTLYPLTGGMPANIRPCAFWKHPPAPRVPLSDQGPDNILLVQNLRDPATPYSGALAMRRALGADRTRQITVDQGGHAVFAAGPNKCAIDNTLSYLLGNEIPREVTCAAEPENARRTQLDKSWFPDLPRFL